MYEGVSERGGGNEYSVYVDHLDEWKFYLLVMGRPMEDGGGPPEFAFVFTPADLPEMGEGVREIAAHYIEAARRKELGGDNAGNN